MNHPPRNCDTPNRCPVDLALDMVAGKWRPMILHRLHGGTLRFGQLQRAIPDVSHRMLTLELRELERNGLVARKVYAQVPPKVEYSLTAAAHRLIPALEAMGRWLRENDLVEQGSAEDAGPG